MSYNFTETQRDRIVKYWGREIYLKILRDIEIYSKKWRLFDLVFHEYFSINAIFFCKSEIYGDCVLKIGSDEQDELFPREYNTLREYDGRRFVKVYESDIDIKSRKKAMLIERVIPGKMLTEEPLEKRIAVFSDLFNGLHIVPKNPEIYDTYEKLICDAAEECKESCQDLKGLNEHMQKAKEIYFEICEKYNKKMLLHIDIYGDNILSDSDGYRIIDPKGVIGDPVFETGQFLFAELCENDLHPENAKIIFDYFEENLNIDGKILRQCFYIETVRFVSYYATRYGAKQHDVDRVNFAEAIMSEI